MFNLNFKNIPKIGFVVTLFVFTTACAHQAVAPANNDASAVIEPTPAPLSDVEGYDSKPAPVKHKGFSKKKKSHKSASTHRATKKKVAKAPAVRKEAPVAAMGTVTETAQLPPAPPMPTPELTAEHSAMIGSVRDESTPVFQSLWEQAEDYLFYILMALGTVGIVLIASRLERKRVKGRRKIVFN